jgi:glycosyltransferase involved in cell wall biosynthesis
MVKAAAAQDERIAHNGFVQGEAKACLLGDSDFLVIASRCLENAPISILEAYSHGLGVLGSSVGGIPELVREGESGYLFRPGDHEQLAAVIRRLLVDRETVMHTRQKARELAEEYTAEKMYLEYAKIYMEVLGAGAG